MTTTADSPRARSLGVLALALVAVFAVAAIGGLATDTGAGSWYDQLVKPPWNPPNWLFGPVWTVLYVAQAVAAWLVWRSGGRAATTALVWFGVQLVLNLGWSLVFFGLESPEAALVEIVVLLIAIGVTIVLFARHNRLAAWLLVPYLAWVAFATALTGAIAWLN